MKKIPLLILLFLSSAAFGLEFDELRSLSRKLRPAPEVREQIESAMKTAETLDSPNSREQIALLLERMIQYGIDFPLVREGTFLQKQSHLIAMAAKALKQEEFVSLGDFSVSQRHDLVHFIVDIETGENIGVFKSEGPRDRERLTWEVGVLFGIEEVLTPALSLTLYGRTGEFQAYQKTDLETEQTYMKEMYGLVTFESYMKCSLAVLLMALYDMHNENCFYQFRREGYIEMGFWDTTNGFDRDSFVPYTVHEMIPTLDTPYAWIGWDYPQRERTLTKRFKPKIITLMNSWPKRIQMFRDYLRHPLTPTVLTEGEAEALIQRALKLHRTITQNPEAPIRSWHEALCPSYPVVAKAMAKYFPDRDPMWTLFRLRWIPEEAYSWMDPSQQEEFQQWVTTFLSQ